MINQFTRGLILSSLGSFWWGFFGVIYFKYISFIGYIEVVVHRCLWTTFILFIAIFYFSKWNFFFKTFFNKKKMILLFFSSFLIFINWSFWIYAVSVNKIIDASFGYFIMPILSVLFGYIFFKEKLNKKRIISIVFVLISIIFLIIINFKNLPWIGVVVGISWALYNLVRKKIKIDTDIGLFIENLYILPFAILAFYFIFQNKFNDFTFSDPLLMMQIFLAGPMTLIPLFLYIKGVGLSSLGAAGMIFYITPSLQFILGYFYFDEEFSLVKLLSFILIWIGVIIYLKDLYETN